MSRMQTRWPVALLAVLLLLWPDRTSLMVVRFTLVSGRRMAASGGNMLVEQGTLLKLAMLTL